MSIVERNMLRDFLRQQVSRTVSLAHRDKGSLFLFSEGLTREAGQEMLKGSFSHKDVKEKLR
ncbi:MAG TPA: hypothetical protein VFW58_05410 [Trichococcus sp.]|nr:hypothetical protein [Trichococcus sp.]